MVKFALQKDKPPKHGKCVKCGKRDATRDDQLCDSCRFMATLDTMVSVEHTVA